ncbi:SDR family NAD(P)-dependent oxidoreductase [Fibrisoma montanum]|uniref:SDR family NAD(P)-dependent oxidoreductase n=1 Tax=Fibrisoma montanum TaxID=2305895 RepID=A0A418LWS7_9BACT|nr:SDR family NAD(P)-dependent oxidoreductase [Fibrisoma montanum]RIV17663.1 SDR family NAD(P)-dependent oxidoreductase [Fibrisoma montanum]
MNNHLLLIGAGSGLSLAIAYVFGQQGYRVSLVARQAASLNQLVQELSDARISVSGYATDVSQFDQFRQTLDDIEREQGPASVMVYNPSIYRQASVLEVDPEVFMTDQRTNFGGLIVAAQAVTPQMLAEGGGTILITGGGSALNPAADLVALSVGKAGVRTVAKCLHDTLEPQGIHVATVTINGSIVEGTHVSPSLIAPWYWELHQEAAGEWTFERIYE